MWSLKAALKININCDTEAFIGAHSLFVSRRGRGTFTCAGERRTLKGRSFRAAAHKSRHSLALCTYILRKFRVSLPVKPQDTFLNLYN